MKLIYLIAGVLTVTIFTDTHAEDATNSDGWKGNVELGIVTTSGNTETETVNAKAKIGTEQENWRHTISIESLNSSTQSTSTAERYAISGQSDYKFGNHYYFFGVLDYEDDSFSGYNYRVSETLGLGRRVISNSALTLDLELGPGARQSKLNVGGSENEVTVRGAGKLAWKISDTSSFTQDLSSDVGEDVTITKSVSALTAQVNGSLATKISYTIKNTSDVPVGIEKTDTEMSVTLVYSF